MGRKCTDIVLSDVSNTGVAWPQAGLDFTTDRSYVYIANNGNDTMSIVDAVDWSSSGVVATRQFLLDFPDLTNYGVETMAGSESGKLLFLVSPNRERILKYELSGVGVDGDNPAEQPPFVVGPSPRRVALQK